MVIAIAIEREWATPAGAEGEEVGIGTTVANEPAIATLAEGRGAAIVTAVANEGEIDREG